MVMLLAEHPVPSTVMMSPQARIAEVVEAKEL